MSHRAAVTVVAVTLAVVVGCSSEDPPASLPSSAPPSTTEAAPTSSTAPTTPTTATATGAPTVPAAAQQQTPDGAAAFVQHWFDTLNYAYAAMDTEPFLESSADSCLTCAALARTVESVASRGNLIDGGQISVRNLAPSAVQSGGNATVTALFGADELREVAPDQTLVQIIEADGGDVSYLVDVTWAGSSWTTAAARLLG